MELPIVPIVAGGVAAIVTLVALIVLLSCIWIRRKSLRRKKQDFKSYVERVFNDSVKDKNEFSLSEAYRKVSYPDFPDKIDKSYTLNRSETAAYDEVPYVDPIQDKFMYDTLSRNGTLPHSNKTEINLENSGTMKTSTPKQQETHTQVKTQDKEGLPSDQPDVVSSAVVARRKLTPQISQMSDEVFMLPPQREEHEEKGNNNDAERVNIESMKYSAVNTSFEAGDEGITRL